MSTPGAEVRRPHEESRKSLMARKPGSSPQAMKNRAAKTAAAIAPASALAQAAPAKKKDDVVIEDIGDEPINLDDIPF